MRFLASIAAICALWASLVSGKDNKNNVHQVSLHRHSVKGSKVFSFYHRPWARMVMERSNPATQLLFKERRVAPRIHLGGSVDGLPVEQLYGGITSVGEYYVELLFGGQPVRVQVDTGSSTLAVPLSDCTNCRRTDQRFDIRKAVGTASVIRCDSAACLRNSCGVYAECEVCSASNRACCSKTAPGSCGFFLRYADNSGAQGALVEADVTLAGLKAPVMFGGILKQIHDFETSEVDGILGMAYKSLACNPTCVEPLFDTLVDTGRVSRNVFSMCTGEEGGTLTLGGNDPNQYEGDLKYVPMGKQNFFYDVKLTGLRVNGNKVNLPSFSNGIVDSGTTLLVTSVPAYSALKKYFQTHYCHVPALCPESRTVKHSVRVVRPTERMNSTVGVSRAMEDDNTWFSPAACVNLEQSHIDQLPTISMQLEGGVELAISPDEYMLKLEIDDPWPPFAGKRVIRCLGIAYLPGMENFPNDVIIGDTVLQKYYYEIDREKNRVGFAPSKKCVLSQETVAELRHQAASNAVVKPTRCCWWRSILTWGVFIALATFVLFRIKERVGYTAISG